MKTVQYNDSQTDQYRNQTITGFDIWFQMTANANNVSIEPVDLQFRNTSISIKLFNRRQDNGSTDPITIFSSTLDVFLKLANYKENPVRAGWALQTMNFTSAVTEPFLLCDMVEQDNVLQLQTTSLPQIRIIASTLNLPGVITVTGNEYVEMTMTLSSGTAVAGGKVSAGAGTSAAFGQVNGHGVEHGVPTIDVVAIQQNQGTVSVSAGEEVSEIYMLNMDRLNINSNNQVITNYSISGSSGGLTILFNELLCHRSTQCPNWWDALHIQDFLIYQKKHDQDKNAKNVSVVLNVANVTAANNYLVVSGFKRSSADTRKYLATNSFNHLNNLRRVGIMGSKDHASQMSAITPHL